MRVSDYIVKFLIENDVDIVFGVPGDTSMCFHNAFEKEKASIKYLACRDERHAVYMADTYSRVSGKIGVCDVPSGGGLLYAVPGLSEATSSSIPIVCFSSDIAMDSEGTGALTELKQEAVSEAVTKWNITLKKPSKTLHTMKKAFRIAQNGRPGAVHISIPEDVHESEVKGNIEGTLSIQKNKYVNYPASENVDQVTKLFSGAERPIILAGGGVHLSSAHHSLENIAINYDIPVVTSLNGKGAVKETLEQSLGVIGVNGGQEVINEVVQSSDLVLVLGSKLNNVTTVGKTLFNKEAKLIQVDISEEILDLNFDTTLSFQTDINSFLTQLNLSLSENNYKNNNEEYKRICIEQSKKSVTELTEEIDRETPLVNPAQIVSKLDKLTDENAIFVMDAGTQNPYMATIYKTKKSTRQTVFDRGHGNLGYALSAAFGAYYAKPEASKVFSLFGDGSFAMSAGELETAARENTPIVFMHFQNNTYGWIKKLHQLYYDEKYIAVDFNEIEGSKVAEGFGVKSRKITHNDEVEDAIQWAINEKGPVFLDFYIELITDIIPPVTNWRADSKKDPKDRQALTY
jgi:acetolactate synthase-1/2/3 large subunit